MAINLSDYKRIHFIGIGGISMSGLAEILSNEGFLVSGSDSKKTDITEGLKRLGIPIYIGHDRKNVSRETNLVVYTAAVQKDNPEILEALDKDILTIDRALLVGEMMRRYSYPLCVAGTHGKTTTTSMLAEVFLAADKDPTISVGGMLPSIHSNVRAGAKEFFLAEACEYCDSFLKFNPYAAIILNIDEDHVDYFKDMAQITASFKSFANRLPEDGLLVINSGVDNLSYITEGLTCRVVTFGFENAAWTACDIAYDEKGCASYTVLQDGAAKGRISLKVPGAHNILNSLSVCALSHGLGIDTDYIVNGLSSFAGTERRFQIKGAFNGVTVIDDYAHHPTEIDATIKAAKNYKSNKLWCVFQPHTFSRTKAFLSEFAKALSCADEIIVMDIYAARETDTLGVHSMDLVNEIRKLGKNALYFEDFDKAGEFLRSNCGNGDILITMGAGDVYLLGERLV